MSINTNPQSMATGWVGVVASELNNQNGLDQNPALLSSNDKVVGVQLLNYSPFGRQSAIQSRLFESGVFASFGKHAFSVSSRYMLLPELTATDVFGSVLTTVSRFEFFLAAGYSIKISEKLSLGAGLKNLHSNVTGGLIIQGTPTQAANVFAGDLGLSYRTTLLQNERFSVKWNAGMSILNIGSKLSYSESMDPLFLPQTLKLGSLFTLKWKKENSYYFAVDFSYQVDKLLVPTPPVYSFNPMTGYEIVDGYDPNVNPFRGALQSFYDAPGGFKEELRELIHQVGSEARLSFAENKCLVAIRAGYFNEHATKGNRKFITAGAGIGFKGIRADFARLFPTEKDHPLKGTYFVSLGARISLNEGSLFSFVE